ncbi:hypothetical protein [Psychrobacter sp. FDAARGOS_221]|uniref:hypothetical protein n=1 Tax=Psychrobacter sp. FDAARGOS_221 TaxID=1975705 RepID=UPI000BB57B27|nr:hypothetical protein [Psychrobacter sp. FDAARGOS_221]PNK61019.1 hypothetical protein A6J60_009080 [Psychrobacter sp. FDAARGOS_221]
MQNKKGIFKLQRYLLGTAAVASILGLSACQSTTGCVAGESKCFKTPSKVFKQKSTTPQLNPQFNYIKLNMNGQTLWLAQGATQQWPAANTKVFYSADRSVFKWSNGRLISVTTPLIDWREQLQQPFSWSAAKPFQFRRQVDQVNGVVAWPQLREVNEASQPKHHSYVGENSNLIWLHETTINPSQSASSQPYATFDYWYAFDSQSMNEPVYGQQCISKQYCLSWQVWKTL